MLLQTTDNSIAGAVYSYNSSLVIYKTNNETLPAGVVLPANLFPLNQTVHPGDLTSLDEGQQIIRGPRMVNSTFYLSITRSLATQSSDYKITNGSTFGYLTIVSKATSLLNVVTTSDLDDGSRLSLIKIGVNGTRSTLDEHMLAQNLNYTYVTPSLMCLTCYNYQFPLTVGTPEYLALINGTSGAIINYNFPQYGMVSAGYAPVTTFWQVWGVVVFQPHKYVYGPIRTIQKLSIIAVFSIGAGVCIATLLLSGWVLRPITRLQAATEQSYGDSHNSGGPWRFFKNSFYRIFRRNSDQRSSPKCSNKEQPFRYAQDHSSEFRLPEKVVTRKHIRDELTELTETFNEMTIELRRQYRNLEERVQQRTKEIKTAKSLAETANEAKSLFIANITHELRTPLNGILGMAAVAMEDDDPQSVRESLKVIFKSGELLLRLLTDLLSFSKSEVDNMKLEIKGFNIAEIISQLHAIFDENSKAAKINFSIEMKSDWLLKYELDGDINRILQIIINLVSNSLKFTPASGFVNVTISAGKNNDREPSSRDQPLGTLTPIPSTPNESISEEPSNDPEHQSTEEVTVSFVVRDSGSGIAPHLQSRVFEPFVQGEIGAKETRSGAGLGLSICRHLATLMNGTIELQSEVGNGSCFTFKLPMNYRLLEFGREEPEENDTERFLEFHNDLEKVSLDISSDSLPRPDSSSKKTKELDTVQETSPVLVKSSYLPSISDSYTMYPNTNSQSSIKRTLDPTICEELRILVAEDNRVNQEVMMKMLHLEGIKKIQIANDGVEAVVAVRKCQPATPATNAATGLMPLMSLKEFDIIFMDIQMPNMDGIQATERIRSLGYSGPIIAVSAYTDKSNVDRCLEAGVNDFLGKPLRRQQLHSMLSVLVERRRCASTGA